MADIRIKDLATTAASTASDDFVAVDGSANGTRKLNAYSPAFGGNLTFGTSASVLNGTTGSIGLTATGTNQNITLTPSGTGRAIINANSLALNVLGTNDTSLVYGRFGTSGSSGQLYVGVEGNTAGTLNTGTLAYAGYIGTASSGTALQLATAGGVRATITSGGNFLVGTTTDSANGKVQLADHTTSAGGIGFGTETSLYRQSAGRLAIDYIGGTSSMLMLRENGSTVAELQTVAGDFYISTATAGKSLYLRSDAGTTALTLDSSQRAQFAGTTDSTSSTTGALTVAGGVGIAKNLFVANTTTAYRFQLSSGGPAGAYSITQNGSSQLQFNGGSSGYVFNDDANTINLLTLGNTGNATFAGTVTTTGGTLSTNQTGNTARLALQRSDTSWIVANETDFRLYAKSGRSTDPSGGTNYFQITNTGATTIGGSLTTSAPTGGAGAWELGVANTVSPTAPNRTITIEIGGTVYYLHAKTTND